MAEGNLLTNLEKAAAIHEAGHVVMYRFLIVRIQSVEIGVKDGRSGIVRADRVFRFENIQNERITELDKSEGAKQIMINLAGPCAQGMYDAKRSDWFKWFKDRQQLENSQDETTDWNDTLRVANVLCDHSEESVDRFIRKCADWTEEVIGRPRTKSFIELLATQFFEQKTLNESEVYEAISMCEGDEAFPTWLDSGPEWRKRITKVDVS